MKNYVEWGLQNQNRQKYLSLLLSVLFLLISSPVMADLPNLGTPFDKSKIHSDRILAKVSSLDSAKKMAAENNLKIITVFENLSEIMGGCYLVFEKSSSQQMSVRDMIRSLESRKDVQMVSPDSVVGINAIPNDPKFQELWGLQNKGQTGGLEGSDINAPEAWDLTTGGKDIIVAVIDTGVNYNHEDLAQNMWQNPDEIPGNGVDDDKNGYIDDVYGINAINDSGDPLDDNFHGSHCAGTIGAKGDNGIGITGVAWNTKIMALKFLNHAGSGQLSNAIKCLDYVLGMKKKGHNIVVTNNSYRGFSPDPVFKDAIDAQAKLEILFVAAAGNDFLNAEVNPVYPAFYDSENIISVIATDSKDEMARFSNYGFNKADMGAPGVDILSCDHLGGYVKDSGTSMAAPHVSGSAALLASYFPKDTMLERRFRLVYTGDRVKGIDSYCKTGRRLNVAHALEDFERVVANFTYHTNYLDVDFFDDSGSMSSPVKSWLWHFGDGTLSNEQNPTHTFRTKGTYLVSLMVTNETGEVNSFYRLIEVDEPIKYCPSASESFTDVHISRIYFGLMGNDSSGGSTYTNYPNKVAHLRKTLNDSWGFYYYLIPNILDKYDCAWRFWIDFNRDGDFNDPGELIIEGTSKQYLTGMFKIPQNVVVGKRLKARISMQVGTYRDACATGGMGEVEDYIAIIE